MSLSLKDFEYKRENHSRVMHIVDLTFKELIISELKANCVMKMCYHSDKAVATAVDFQCFARSTEFRGKRVDCVSCYSKCGI